MDWKPIDLAERGLVPDGLVRVGIRRLIARRLREETAPDCEAAAERLAEFEAMQRAGSVAVATADANAQHYEVPTGFFRRVLGPRLKYSACLFAPGITALGDAEEAMLALTCERAGVADGMDILELGCGWGSLSLWMAERYPAARIVAVSNSATQRAFIEERAREQGLANLRVVTRDMNEFDTDDRFDRVVSVEMLEHMRNHPLLFERIASWLRPGGRLFFHIFCHRRLAYLFGTDGEDDWMGRHFFTGGMMPSVDLTLRFQEHLVFETMHQVNGRHYARTARAWLANLDRERAAVTDALGEDGASPDEVRRRVNRWRLFFLAVEELFAWRGGNEWFVTHQRFRRR